jgi:DNA-binding NarL/FixJ family response regulator
MIRVLIADDHAIVRDGLAAIINRQRDLDVVGEATTGEEAVSLFPRLHPDVTLMDIRMPGMDGVEAIKELRRLSPVARILVLTVHDGDEYIHRAIDSGAAGYLLKSARRQELLDAIRHVHSGQRYFSTQVTSRMVEYGPRSDLSQRETEVLQMIASGCSNKEIGCNLGITEGTVKGHVSTILSKLNSCDRTGAVTTALKRGIIRL